MIHNDRMPKKFVIGFVVLIDSAGHDDFQKKSIHKSDPGKGVNLHILKRPPMKPIMYY